MSISEKIVELNLSEIAKVEQKEIAGGNTDDPCTGGYIDPSDPDTWDSTGPFNPCENN
jgi:hypothetical protein